MTQEAISASTDDAYSSGGTHPGTGTNSLTATTIRLGAITTVFYAAGFRFQSVPIPQGATINSASLSVLSTSGQSTPFDVMIYCEDADDSATFSTGSMPATRTLTSASYQWNVGTAAWSESTRYSTGDLAALVQEVVNRAGWAENSNLSFIILNTATTLPAADNRRIIDSYDSGASNAVTFDCEFTTGSGISSVLHHVTIYGGI